MSSYTLQGIIIFKHPYSTKGVLSWTCNKAYKKVPCNTHYENKCDH